jgi:hypothetical protein
MTITLENVQGMKVEVGTPLMIEHKSRFKGSNESYGFYYENDGESLWLVSSKDDISYQTPKTKFKIPFEEITIIHWIAGIKSYEVPIKK